MHGQFCEYRNLVGGMAHLVEDMALLVRKKGSNTVGKRSAGGECECGVVGLVLSHSSCASICFLGGRGGAGYRGSCIKSMEGLFANW